MYKIDLCVALIFYSIYYKHSDAFRLFVDIPLFEVIVAVHNVVPSPPK